MNVEKLKIAVVGFGKMGMLHASILNVLPGVQLIALCEKSGLIRKFLKKAFSNIYVVDDVEKFSNLDLDAIYVTTPIPSHFPVAKNIYSAGIACNLFIEKTLASNFDDAKKLCDLAQKFGGVNMVGYMRRFTVTFLKAKDLLDGEVIGEPISFKAYAFSSDFFRVKQNSKVQTPSIGILRDLGCHAIDLALWFFGDFEVEKSKLESIVSGGSEDSAYITVKAPNGLYGEFNVSWCVDKHRMPEVGFMIKGPKGVMNVNDDNLELVLSGGKRYRWFRHDLGDSVAFWLGRPEYYREDEYFVNAVINKNSVEPSFQISAKVDRLIDEIKAKAY
ncbi:Gfo/Idh/MocA family oxidoreductase [Candidatus Bathyarchaeota archaeon]|nr:Gfo/Idh/MocA family oxidoreductase [Candidatus Bathyarchaeota archaeon]